MSPMTPATATRFLREYRHQHGLQTIESVPSLALAVRMVPGYRPEDDRALYEPSVFVYPVVHPVLEASMIRDGATPVGSMSWVVGAGAEEPNVRAIATMLRTAHAGTVLPHAWVATQRGPRDLSAHDYQRGYPWSWLNRIGAPPQVHGVFDQFKDRHAVDTPYRADPAASRFGVISVTCTNRTVLFRAYTHRITLPKELVKEIGEVDLNLRPAPRSARRTPQALRPAEAVALLEWAATVGFEIVDADGTDALAVLRQRLAHAVVAWTRPGRPAEAVASIGVHAHRYARPDAPRPRRSLKVRGRALTDFTPVHCSLQLRPPTASRLVNATSDDVATWSALGVPCVVHEAVADVARLSAATPIEDARLRPFQRVAVGRHLATTVGYANVCSPGAGKTVMSLEALRRRSLGVTGYRALVVAEANVRRQFADEAAIWFPEARVIVIERYRDADRLVEALADPTPVLVVTSYALASSAADVVETFDVESAVEEIFTDVAADETTAAALAGVNLTRRPRRAPRATARPPQSTLEPAGAALGRLLTSTHWNDLVADEAACLRNPSSRQSRALWALRERADVAVALTGTPISRSVDDLGRIVAWARRDPHMFHGDAHLSSLFDLSTAAGRRDFQRALGPVVLRYDKSEFADELPPVAAPQVIRVTLSPAEKRLSDAARDELKRVYQELVDCLASAEGVDRNDPAYAEISQALAAARSAWLGGTQLARMAASDPASLLGSNSAGAALLDAQGLISAATAQRGTKRTRVVEECVIRVAAGERIVVFTEFASVARGLIADLRDAGLRVGEILGGGGSRRDRHVSEFARGELDVMVATSAGERGLNLQTATTLIHVDTPWAADQIAQRHGRIERIGATAQEIQIVFVIAEGTIEERVTAIVASRAATALQALDTSRGIDVKDTDVARTMRGLIDAADLRELRGRDAVMLEMTRALLA